MKHGEECHDRAKTAQIRGFRIKFWKGGMREIENEKLQYQQHLGVSG